MFWRNIDADRERRIEDEFLMPLRHLPASFFEHPLSQVDDQVAFFGDGDEFARRKDTSNRVVPPDQRFITYDPPVLYAQFRLVIEYQLLRIDGFPKSCLDFEASNGPLAHPFVEHGKTRLAAGLGVIHGGVRIAQQVFRRVSRGTQRDPYTDGGKHLASIQLKRG